ncbi:hypothetical protein DFJ63DRAFT_311474 [Scheffersomyces coipomensis]|uniref:uncharacterized protein n=1 Tax=Scheffersomyces coipomensis TaxID=1788519 RepID=UPI00315DCB1C
MAVPKKTAARQAAIGVEERISKMRFANSFILTILFLIALVIWIYHGIWAFKVVYYKPYGHLLNNIIYGPGTFVADFGLSLRLLSYINDKLLSERIEADYKKYI